MAAITDKAGVARAEAQPIISPKPSAGVLRKLSADERERLDYIFAEPIDCIYHESFSQTSTAQKLFADRLEGRWSTRPWCNGSPPKRRPTDGAFPRSATLTREQEGRLFLCFNYARFRMGKLLAKFAGKHMTTQATSELLWWHSLTATTRAEIIEANLPLVLAMVKRTRLGNIDYAELISEGNMALLRSVNKFDCSRGFKFSTYACRAILKSFSRVAMRTTRYRGRFPTEFDPSLEKSNYIEQLRDEHKADCVDELCGIIKKNSAELNDVEFKVIQARFALGKSNELAAAGPKTLEQVGLLIGVTKERVRQIQNRALEKLRVKLQDDFLAA
jgi:RNA polymerase sigma factor (sigma-70 family)